ncbi:hypothetical protein FRC03_011839 [Tulasnella sp. 419]|nr:hypothetical protein FRC03_011839 [Tulasnella sp. 419]
MFGEEESESPRMPSPWEAITAGTTPSLSHCSTPLSFSSSKTLNGGSDGDGSDYNTDGQLSGGVGTPSMIQETGRLQAFPRLVPEIEEGNVEYKLKLISPTPQRFTRLVTQLKYRLLEGGGQALYEIGVSDDGQLVGLTKRDLEESLITLDRMAGELGVTVIVLKEIELPELLEETEKLRRRAAAIIDIVKAPTKPKQGRKNKAPGISFTKKVTESAMTRVVASTMTLHNQDLNLSQPAVFTDHSDVGNPVVPKPTFPIPIIRSYPYGMKPYIPGRISLSLESNTSTSLSEPFSTQFSSNEDCIGDLFSTLDHGFEESSFNLANVPDDPFEFGFDLEISSFTRAMNLDAPISSLDVLNASTSRGNMFLQPTDGSINQEFSVKPKKAIVLYPPAKDPAQKASERRMKRDRRRKERIEVGSVATVSKDTSDPSTSSNVVDPSLNRKAISKDASSHTIAPPRPCMNEVRFIAEALVVRKLAQEEIFLDFGGFNHAGTSDDDQAAPLPIV